MSYSVNAYAKINLGLDVLRKRPDGYHDLKMVMQSIELHDVLTFDISEGSGIYLKCDKEYLSCGDDNLIVRAARMLTTEFDIKKRINIYLNKNIPVAAGMAGGSADAAATLIAVNDMLGIGLSTEALMKYGVKLGADIPFCIMGGTALSEGIGDILTPLPAPANAHILIAKPLIDVSTKFVYSNLMLTKDTLHPDIDAIIKALPVNIYETGRLLGNILETVTIPAHPIIDQIKLCMTENGAAASLMSGSGPAVFGIYEHRDAADKALEECLKLDDDMFAAITTYHNNR